MTQLKIKFQSKLTCTSQQLSKTSVKGLTAVENLF